MYNNNNIRALHRSYTSQKQKKEKQIINIGEILLEKLPILSRYLFHRCIRCRVKTSKCRF